MPNHRPPQKPSQSWSPGRPFAGDYPDPRSPAEREQEQREVRRQVEDLARRTEDRAFQRELISALQDRDRRARHAEKARFTAAPAAARQRGLETLILSGELLVRAEILDVPAARHVIDPHRFNESAVECLDGRVVRLANPDKEAPELTDIARSLRRAGFPASVTHVTPLGPIAKGLGGPEPSAGARPFPGGAAGHGVQVAVVDTGVTAEVRSDGWLKDVPRDGNVDRLDLLPQPDGFLDFGAGHGTFTAGVAQQVAPGAELRVYQAMDTDGIGSEVDVACDMVRAVRDGARILNLSLGTNTLDDQPPVAIQAALEIIGEIEEDTGEDVLVVAAAGNSGGTRPSWPAAFRRVVSVAALTADGRPAPWSDHGFWVDCSVVGEGVMSTYVAGKESSVLDPDPDEFGADAWAVWSGTSFAAPQLAGAVARLSHESGASPRQALRALLRQGTPIPDYGRALEILPGT